MELKNILWATDGSPESKLALKYATFLSSASGAQIIGVHVIPMPVQMLFDSLTESEKEFIKIQEEVEKNVTSRFFEIKTDLEKSGIEFDGVILKGIPSEKIRELSVNREADLIVMGKRGHGLIDSILAGSSTVRVLQNSHIPVLAVKDTGVDHNGISINRILVPHDISDCHDTAMNYALDLASITGAELLAVYALRLDMYAQDIPAGALDMIIRMSRKELDKQISNILSDYKAKGNDNFNPEISTEVIHGISPAITVSNYAADKMADLIVIHTHGRKGITRLILGSVTEKIIPEAPCSVLALRPE